MAGASSGVAILLALAAGALIGRDRPGPWRRPIETLLALPWALPGTVFAIALATTFSVHHPWQLRWVLVGTVALLPLAYLVRSLPLPGRAVLPGDRPLGPALPAPPAS